MSKEHKSVLLTPPQHLGLKTIDGEPKTLPIYVDVEMANLIETLWSKGIGTVGCCKGLGETKTVNDNVAWFQIGSGWGYPNWISETCIEKAMRALNEVATFPVYMYDPRFVPIDKPKIHILRRHYEKLLDSGYEFDIPFTIWF